jgi:Flp pilus assembly protein TadB
MNSSNDFKSLWNQQQLPAIPDVKEIFRKADRLKRKTRNKLLFTNFLMAATIAYIIFIILFFHPQMITTKLGALLVIIAIVFYLVVANQLLTALFKNNIENNSKAYLNEMLQMKKKQDFLQKTMLNIYFILLTAGLLLYMIEYTMRMTFVSAAISYLVTLGWMVFNWFYFRKKILVKRERELNEVISMLENAIGKSDGVE